MNKTTKQLFKGAITGVVAFVCFIFILVVCIISSCILSFLIPAKINDPKMDRFEKSVLNLSVLNSPDFEIITIDKRFGLLVGNGNHCDANIAVLFQSELDHKDVYTTIESIDFDKELDFPYSSLRSRQYNNPYYWKEDHIQLYYLQNNEIYAVSDEQQLVKLSSSYDKPRYKFLENLSDKASPINSSNYYILSIIDFEGYSLTTDFRCR